MTSIAMTSMMMQRLERATLLTAALMLPLACAWAAGGVPQDPLSTVPVLAEVYAADADDDDAVKVREAFLRGGVNFKPIDADFLYDRHYKICVQSRRAQGLPVEELPRSAFPSTVGSIVRQQFQAGDVALEIEQKSQLMIDEACKPYWKVDWSHVRMILSHPEASCTITSAGSEVLPPSCLPEAISAEALKQAMRAPPPSQAPHKAAPGVAKVRTIAGIPCEEEVMPMPPFARGCVWRLQPPRGGPHFGDLHLDVEWPQEQGRLMLESGGEKWVELDLFHDVVLAYEPSLSGLTP